MGVRVPVLDFRVYVQGLTISVYGLESRFKVLDLIRVTVVKTGVRINVLAVRA